MFHQHPNVLCFVVLAALGFELSLSLYRALLACSYLTTFTFISWTSVLTFLPLVPYSFRLTRAFAKKELGSLTQQTAQHQLLFAGLTVLAIMKIPERFWATDFD